MSHQCWITIIVSHLLFSTFNSAETINANQQQYMNGNIVCNTAEDCIIICDEFESCKNANIICPPNYQCDIHCNNSSSVCDNAYINCANSTQCNIDCSSSFKSCINTTMDCPFNGGCNVGCMDNQACLDANIIWKHNQPNDIQCANEYRSCNGITISAGDQNSHFQFICNGSVNSEVCEGTIFKCPRNASCNIHCIGVRTCQKAIINGPIDHSLTVNCDPSMIGVCNYMTIYVQSASLFILKGCTHSTGNCANINIYFPSNNKGTAVGNIIEANSDGLSEPTFYALNGWLDVNMLNYSGGTIYGIMYCNVNYSVFCEFNNSFQCSECNAPILPTKTSTTLPTSSPTQLPVQSTIVNNIVSPDVIFITIAFNYSVTFSSIPNIQSVLQNLTLSIIHEATDNVTYNDCKDISTNINVKINEVENGEIGIAVIGANITLCVNSTQNVNKLRVNVDTYLQKDFLAKLQSEQIVLIANSSVNIDVDILSNTLPVSSTDASTTILFDDSDTFDNGDDNVLMILSVIGCCIICCILLICGYIYHKAKKENIKNKTEMDVAMSTSAKKQKRDVAEHNDLLIEDKSKEANDENQKEIEANLCIQNDDVTVRTSDEGETAGNNDMIIKGDDETIGEDNCGIATIYI